MPRTRISCLTSLLLWVLGSGASAQTTLNIDVGWGKVYRQGRWNPIFITATDARVREVEMELYAPQTGTVATIIHQNFTIAPAATTFAVYAPLASDLSQNVVTLRDAKTHRWLASKSLGSARKDPRGEATEPVTIAPDTNLIAISGRESTSKTLQAQLTVPRLASGFIAQSRLPFHAIGYDSIDILMLSAPDLTKLSIEQQEAIIAWVRAGGKLVMWPGQEPNALGPLVEALPCKIDDVEIFDLPQGKLLGRKLSPAYESETFTLFATSGPTVYRRMFGFGTILLLPVDISSLRFGEEESKACWKRLLTGTVPLATKPDLDPRRFYNYTEDPRRIRATSEIVAWAKGQSGDSRFDFEQIAIVLMGLLLIVGPVDSIVLRMLGQSPWTRVTSAGWASLVLLALSYGVHRASAADSHFLGVQLIDEAAGSRVAVHEIIGLNSRSGFADAVFATDSWWTSAMRDQSFPQVQDFRQNQQGNRPIRLANTDDLLLELETFTSGRGAIHADLRRTGNQLTGKITNRGAMAFDEIIIRTADGAATLKTPAVSPGETAQVEASIDTTDRSLESINFPPREPPTGHPSRFSIYNLNLARASQIDELLHTHSEYVCIYAEVVRPVLGVELKSRPARVSNISIIRALVRLAPTTQPSK